MAGKTPVAPEPRAEHLRRTRRLLRDAPGHRTKRAHKLLAFVAFAYLFLKLIPGFEKALKDLQNVELQWVVGAMGVETVSQIGYVISWRGILDRVLVLTPRVWLDTRRGTRGHALRSLIAVRCTRSVTHLVEVGRAEHGLRDMRCLSQRSRASTIAQAASLLSTWQWFTPAYATMPARRRAPLM
jgi:hypothetical protein